MDDLTFTIAVSVSKMSLDTIMKLEAENEQLRSAYSVMKENAAALEKDCSEGARQVAKLATERDQLRADLEQVKSEGGYFNAWKACFTAIMKVDPKAFHQKGTSVHNAVMAIEKLASERDNLREQLAARVKYTATNMVPEDVALLDECRRTLLLIAQTDLAPLEKAKALELSYRMAARFPRPE